MSSSDGSSESAKRSFAPGSPTGHTPKGKKKKRGDILLELVSELYTVVPNGTYRTHRDAVRVRVQTELDRLGLPVNATSRNVGWALGKAFPGLRRTGFDHGMLNDLTEVVPAAIEETDKKHPMLLTCDEAIFMNAVRNGNLSGVLATPGAKEMLTRLVIDIVNKEVEAYTHVPDALLRNSDPEALLSFSLPALKAEFERLLPTLSSIIYDVSHRTEMGPSKTLASIQGAMTTVLAKILGIYSNKLSVWRHLSALILSAGGAKDTCVGRFQATYDSVAPITLRRKLDALAATSLQPLAQWTEDEEAFTIVFDNVNKHVRVRRQTYDNSNKMHNLTHAIAIKNRVDVSKFSQRPLIDVSSLTVGELIPSVNQGELLKSEMVTIVLEIWSTHVKSLEWVSAPNPPHKYAAETQMKTEKVNLGVLQKDECLKEDMLDILKSYHELVPTTDDDLKHVILAGDYLSFANGKGVQESQADNITADGRLEGLILCMADFHAEMNLLDLIYRILFKDDSYRSAGTLKAAKNILTTKNINSKTPSKTYHDSSELFDKLFTAYVILGALKQFNLEDIDSACDIPEDDRSQELAEQHATSFVDEFVKLNVPDERHEGSVRKACQHCRKTFLTVDKLIGHHQSAHPLEDAITSNIVDPVRAHTSCLLTLGLMRHVLKRSIRLGNGEVIMLVYRFMSIMTKAHGQNNYGCGLLETIMQTYILPHSLSESMIWNRFANNRGKSDSNLPLDLHLEHENRGLKEDLTTFRGIYTQRSLDRVSKARSPRDKLLQKVDRELRTGVGKKAAPELSQSDVRILVNRMNPDELLADKPGRQHSHSLSFVHANPMDNIGGVDMRMWMKERISIAQTKHYYKKFCT